MKMTNELRKQVRGFAPHEKWGNPNMMEQSIIFAADRFRAYVNKKVKVHCGYEPRDTGGRHPKGLAMDCHVEDMHWFDQFIAATRIDELNGIGAYPYWNNPGIHIDSDPNRQVNSYWICLGNHSRDPAGTPKVYAPFNIVIVLAIEAYRGKQDHVVKLFRNGDLSYG